MSKIKITSAGSDPEMFIYDTVSKEYISAEGIVPGTKEEPFEMEEKGYGIQPDNVMVELTFPPALNEDSVTGLFNQLKNHFNKAKEMALKMIQKANVNFVLAVQPSAVFDDRFTRTDHAQTVGCSADYNAWLQEQNPKVDVESTNERWAGGHIHIGLENMEIENIENCVKAFDMFLGVPAIFMDKDDARKKVYGTPGRFRFTEYGFEYRSLSNFWLNNEKTIDWVGSQIEQAQAFLNAGNEVPSEVQQLMIENDKEKAMEFCDKFKINYLKDESTKEVTEQLSRAVA